MKLFCTVLMFLSLVACAGVANRYTSSEKQLDFKPDERPIATTLVYACNDYEFVARLGPGEMALWLPDRHVILSQVRNASGTLYQEGEVSFWSKGEEAMLTVGGQDHKNCHLRPDRAVWEDARRRGVNFRGVGTDPDWSLEVRTGQQLLLTFGNGTQSILVPEQLNHREPKARVYAGATATHDLRIEILELPCFDAPSGNTFANTVVVMLNGRAYQGCGQNLYYPWID